MINLSHFFHQQIEIVEKDGYDINGIAKEGVSRTITGRLTSKKTAISRGAVGETLDFDAIVYSRDEEKAKIDDIIKYSNQEYRIVDVYTPVDLNGKTHHTKHMLKEI